MRAIAVNGSPRKGWNTHLALEKALEGAAAAGCETAMYHLIDMDYKGCIGCCACKRLGNPRFGMCNVKDGLTPLLEDIAGADVLIVGSPLYLGDVTGMTRSFLERLAFQYLSYDNTPGYFQGKVNCGVIYTMNCPEQFADCQQYAYENNCNLMRQLKGRTEWMMINETWQWDDYSLYAASMFNVPEKKKRREEVWPADLQRCFEFGKSLALD